MPCNMCSKYGAQEMTKINSPQRPATNMGSMSVDMTLSQGGCSFLSHVAKLLAICLALSSDSTSKPTKLPSGTFKFLLTSHLAILEVHEV